MPAGSITATWTGSNSRDPIVATADAPPGAPLAVAVANTAGQWLFAVCSWRQDDSTPAGQIAYPSTISVQDDAGNFWIPVQSGQPSTGIVRSSVWMAPAARPANFVFFQPFPTSPPTAPYQPALACLVAEVQADVPWYSVNAVAAAFTNQGTSISLSETAATGLFTIGCIAYDNATATVTPTATGWTATTTVTTSNGTDASGDLVQKTWTATGAGSTLTLSATTATTMDFASVMIVVHGVTDVIGFPYSLPMEDWPVLITEIASGPTINADPLFANGTASYTGQNSTIAAATWPLWNPWPSYGTTLSGSVKVTPSGSASNINLLAEEDTVSPTTLYNVLMVVYSPTGYAAGTWGAAINWYTSGGSFISTTSGPSVAVQAGEWTLLSLTEPVYPPATAGKGQAIVGETANSGNVPNTAIFYCGYCTLTVADAYEGAPPDQVQWTDFSTRNYTLEAAKAERGIQYEQQQLEAGTFSATLQNTDTALTPGNIQSVYYPTAGDTDVPVRLRAVWPGSLTPYYPLFTGYTDQMEYGWDEDWYGYCKLTASDGWSRLTQQLLSCFQEEVSLDNPQHFWTCSVSGADSAVGSQALALQQLTGPLGAGTQTASFTSSAISLAGAPGLSCWQTQNTNSVGNTGQCLSWFPQTARNVTGGITVEFWFSPQAVSASQPVGACVLCSAWSRKGAAWTLWIDNSNGAANSFLFITVYDKATLAATNHKVGTLTFLGTVSATGDTYVSVSFTQTSITVTVNPGNTASVESGTFACNLNATLSGLTWGGNGGPVGGQITSVSIPTQSYGFMNVALLGISVYSGLLCLARTACHEQAARTAFTGESDVWRMARIMGYSGFTVPLAMRCLDLPQPPGADLDVVTGATDTTSQVASAYYTNIASSTLAGMFVNGTGSLVYRRRLEWYDRAIPQWVAGELDVVPLNSNTLNQSSSTSPWVAENNSTLTSSSQSVNALFFPFAAVFHGDGVTSAPQISYGSFITPGIPVTPGLWYQFSAWVYSPQGYPTGITLALQYWTAGLSNTGTISTTLTPIPGTSLAYLTTGPFRCANLSTQAFTLVSFSGTPASNIQLFVADAVFSQVPWVAAGGATATTPEVPYLEDLKLSSDRAQLYNEAILTQYGTNLISTFTGSSVTFQPSSGVIVLITNQASANLRGSVPYTVTLYTANTIQALPYYANQPTMEDFGNWITQTLGQPLFRPEHITITPAATPAAITMSLQGEVGDTVTQRRRQFGGAETQVLTFASKLTHTFNRESEDPAQAWSTQYELSPFPVGSVLQCDNVIQGCGTGGNLFGF